jgi:hypothetical protein
MLISSQDSQAAAARKNRMPNRHTKKVIEATRSSGGSVIGLGVLCNRGEVEPSDVGNPPKLSALVKINLDAWDEQSCPLCK